MKPLKHKISITLDADLIEWVKRQAERDDRSVSRYINWVLQQNARLDAAAADPAVETPKQKNIP